MYRSLSYRSSSGTRCIHYVHEPPDGGVEEILRPTCQYLVREALWDDRALDYYGKVSCPVLLIPAASQPLSGEEPPEHLVHAPEFAALKGRVTSQVARAIQRCVVLWMPDTVHDIQLQRPLQLSQEILRFLQE